MYKSEKVESMMYLQNHSASSVVRTQPLTLSFPSPPASRCRPRIYRSIQSRTPVLFRDGSLIHASSRRKWLSTEDSPRSQNLRKGEKLLFFPHSLIISADSLEAVGGTKDNEGRMGKLMACLATLEEAFQKSSNGLRFFGGENIGFLDIACGTIFGPVSVIEAFPALGGPVGEAFLYRYHGWDKKKKKELVSKRDVNTFISNSYEQVQGEPKFCPIRTTFCIEIFCVDHCISGTQKEGEIQIHECIKGSRCVWWSSTLARAVRPLQMIASLLLTPILTRFVYLLYSGIVFCYRSIWCQSRLVFDSVVRLMKVLGYGRDRKVNLEAPLYDKDCVLGNNLAAHYLFSSDISKAKIYDRAAEYHLILPENQEHDYVYGMLAFSLLESGHLAEAEKAARKAVTAPLRNSSPRSSYETLHRAPP
ncbi:BnaA07g09610D [Brassica napus]|uniref:BnaA07g09610D protein n=1 Tax=Brassica napus TaxID=3708 RepID=A0A078GK96_BRANA|nr:BnaA07g09610D [Brassica napus]